MLFNIAHQVQDIPNEYCTRIRFVAAIGVADTTMTTAAHLLNPHAELT
jgi:hypothetical protein